MTKRVIAILAAALLIVGTGFAAFGIDIPTPKAVAGVMIDLTFDEPVYTMSMGMSFGNVGLEFGVGETTVTLFPSVHKDWFFAGMRMQMARPASAATEVSIALPIGLQMSSPIGFVRIGYSYPVVNYLEPGFFVEFALEVDFFDLVAGSE